ncbi:MAG: fumarylacetoacetase [Ilumatobacter sp.]|nr:fumarylacetoacetase [Ilumatobacter sp.]
MSPLPVPEGSPFPTSSLPFGIGHHGDGRLRAWAAFGDHAVDLDGLMRSGAFLGLGLAPNIFAGPYLNQYLATGRDTWRAVRTRLREAVDDATPVVVAHTVARDELVMGLPTAPTDYVDFYSSLHHATNLGRMFRPDGDALLPNWRRIPIGYHGRTGTLVADGTPIPRPSGYRLVDGEPEVGPSTRLDIELEVGTVVGVGSELGVPIPIERAGDHLYGVCLVNDWSARDIQAFEYQPLGPFLGKSFATSVSPWLVSFDALEPFRVAPPTQEPPAADYLTTDEPWGFDLHLEVWFDSAAMRAAGTAPVRLSATSFADMYWTPAQQLAHLTVNGASTRPGDLFASGTVSGPTPGTEGSLIELTVNGERPIELPDGTTRSFLLDGDRVELRGWAGSDPARRISLGTVTGTVIPTKGAT